MFISLIFLSGGKGSRLKTPTPKQYLPLGEKPVAFHSLDIFLRMPEISEYIVVADLEDLAIFSSKQGLKFALPGERRQDSVKNGLQKISKKSDLVLIHDGARPFIDEKSVKTLLKAARNSPATTLASPVKSTIRKVKENLEVKKSLKRQELWEMQTPQALTPNLLKKGFALAEKKNLTVTDDVALAELAGAPIKIVEGPDSNMKITTPFDYLIAKLLYEKAL